MATFERCTDNQTRTDAVQHRKYPLVRLEPSIQKFLKVIQIDLARLHRHRLNVEKFNRLQDWTSLHTEQINATRTIQQIKANIHEIEKSRLQVCDEDLEKFDNKINDMKHSAMKSVCEFVDLVHGYTGDARNSSSDSSPGDELQPLTFDSSTHLFQGQMQLNEPPENTQVAESWENLQENLEELNMMIHQFASVVNTQQEGIDRIEDNIEHAHSSVREGSEYLGKSSNYKAAVLPIAGAVVGTMLAGPVGLIAGAKIGGVLGVAGGSVAGFLGGSYFKKRREKVTEMELSKLSRSNSLPDIHLEPADGSSLFGWGRKRNQSTAEIQETSS
ncbi:syntaxin-17-like isoform X2 [Mercenaria mercenaria]|nr:syntaxin-17-like isoform X2 [Mercenaria mercenaria]XP_045178298.2 syntaxin-17-like isoform X2 [Mercenaria mercenaria]XP_045178299.2 syntaxin-17-like isoform X2 [Mercenaria mercenaria]